MHGACSKYILWYYIVWLWIINSKCEENEKKEDCNITYRSFSNWNNLFLRLEYLINDPSNILSTTLMQYVNLCVQIFILNLKVYYFFQLYNRKIWLSLHDNLLYSAALSSGKSSFHSFIVFTHLPRWNNKISLYCSCKKEFFFKYPPV